MVTSTWSFYVIQVQLEIVFCTSVSYQCIVSYALAVLNDRIEGFFAKNSLLVSLNYKSATILVRCSFDAHVRCQNKRC